MYNEISLRISKQLYTSSLWVVRARWYYAFLAYMLAIIAVPTTSFSLVVIPLSLIFGISLIANAILTFYLEHHEAEGIGEIRMWYINISQVIFDVLYIFIILVLSGAGLTSFVQIFFFLPIIIAMMFFGFRGAIAISVISSFFLLFSVIAQSGLLQALLQKPSIIPELYKSANMNLQLAQASVMVLIYMLVGFFSGSVAKLLAAHEAELQKQFLEEESNVNKLSELTRDFELSSKLLVRRDIELTLANDRMQELSVMKTEIISVAAHQLRTPLSGIKWMLKMMLDEDAGKLNEQQHELLSRGYESNEHLIQVVNDLLEVDRLESGRIKYVFALVHIEQLAEKAISELLPKAHSKNMHINFSSSGDIPKLYLDQERIVDMLQNLIDNAIKYSRINSIVSVRTKIKDDALEISVTDSGIGIPEDEQKNVFSRFFRASNALRHNTEGSGLGLSIVENVVLRHGGKISFNSKEGEGTTFIVDLPLTLKKLE